MKTLVAGALLLLSAAAAGAQDAPAAPPAVVTLSDALQKAKQLEPTFLAAVAEAEIAREDRVQARAGMLPAFSYSLQYIGNQGDTPNPTGRFVSMDGVNMYRSWLAARQELSPATFMGTPLVKARAVEAAAQARLEIAQRGLTVTVTKLYYAFVSAQRKYATTQLSAQQAQRFYDIARQQEQLGQVARSDVVKAEISYRQQEQAFAEATLAMNSARMALAVLIFPTFNENFSVVDDMQSGPVLPSFGEVRVMAEKGNPDRRAASEMLRAAGADVRLAKNGLLPSLALDAVYGIEANEFALHSVYVAAPELGVLPNLGYAVTLNLTVPLWDWGGTRSKIHQSEARQRQAQATLTLAQRQLVSNLNSMYNEAMTARNAVDTLRHVAELATESLRLTTLRYQAGESTAFEMVDAQNTAVAARNAADDAEARYRVAIAELQTVTGSF